MRYRKLRSLGIHTGDSITVAPIQTLSDKEYQAMRDEALKCLDKVGIATGGSNVQFAVNPKNGDRIIEMNQEFLDKSYSIKSYRVSLQNLQHS